MQKEHSIQSSSLRTVCCTPPRTIQAYRGGRCTASLRVTPPLAILASACTRQSRPPNRYRAVQLLLSRRMHPDGLSAPGASQSLIHGRARLGACVTVRRRGRLIVCSRRVACLRENAFQNSAGGPRSSCRFRRSCCRTRGLGQLRTNIPSHAR